jgi:hypothetical protein
MNVPVTTSKLNGMELHTFKYDTSPHDREELSSRYYSGYLEARLVYTKEHVFVNPSTYRFLLLRPLVARQLEFKVDNDVFIYTISGAEESIRFIHETQHDSIVDGFLGCDLLCIITQERGQPERTETFVIRHSKGILVPNHMKCE